MAKKKTVVESAPVDETNVIDASEAKVDIEALAESIKNVDTTIPSNEESLKEIENKIIEELKPIQNLQEKVSEMVENQEEFNKIISENPENAETIINNEIKKVEALKREVEKLINSTPIKSKKISNMTSWWNGMGYDF